MKCKYYSPEIQSNSCSYTCQYCGKPCTRPGPLKLHEQSCPSNPNRVHIKHDYCNLQCSVRRYHPNHSIPCETRTHMTEALGRPWHSNLPNGTKLTGITSTTLHPAKANSTLLFRADNVFERERFLSRKT